MPSVLIFAMHLLLSELRMNPIAFEMKLLKFLQFKGSVCFVQSAQLAYEFSMQQLRTLHHPAFVFS